MASVRTATDRSIEVRRRHHSTQTTGVTAPTATSAPRAPSTPIATGARIAPRPTARAPEALQDAEDPRQHLVGGHPGQQGERRDVDQGVPDADDAGCQQGDQPVRQEAHDGERGSPQDDREAEPSGHRPAPHEPGAGEAAEERSDPDRAGQHPDVGLRAAEQVDRDDDDEDREGPSDRRLQDHEPHDDAHPGVGRHGGKPLAQLRAQPPRAGRGDRDPLVRQSHDQDCRDQRADPGEDEDRSDVGDSDEHGGG